jgi:hypothetical protein
MSSLILSSGNLKDSWCSAVYSMDGSYTIYSIKVPSKMNNHSPTTPLPNIKPSILTLPRKKLMRLSHLYVLLELVGSILLSMIALREVRYERENPLYVFVKRVWGVDEAASELDERKYQVMARTVQVKRLICTHRTISNICKALQ